MNRFGIDETDIRKHQCQVCARFRGDGHCAAFPDGIPDLIRLRERDHRQPYPSDHGIRFEALPGQRHPLDVIQETPRKEDAA